MQIGIIGLQCQHCRGLFLRRVDLACSQQEATEFKPGITIRRSQNNCTIELAVGSAVTAKMHVCPRQSQVSLRIGLIALQRVGELDDRFVVFALSAVVLSALEVFQLSNVRINLTA